MADPATLRRIMVDTQVRPSDVTKFPIIAAMLDAPREAYVPAGQEAVAHMDAPIPLARGREMSEPRTLAKTLDALDLEIGDEVLVIGAALGYATAVLARMVTSVVALEEDADLARATESNLAADGVVNVAVIEGPLAEGAPKAAPFDVILIDGGVEQVPDALLDQLREGGRIAATFVDGPLGEVRIGHRANGRVAWRPAFNAGAAPLPGFGRERAFAL